jgi:hypothetical protein
MPFRMHTFNGKMICGKRGGEPFMTATRPNPLTNVCPVGYSPCSTKTSPDNTICYETSMGDYDCPITKFEFINELGDCSDPQADWLEFDQGVSICFSKNANALPSSEIEVENLPCADPWYQIELDTDPIEL